MSYKKARTESDKIKLMTYIQYIQQCWKEKKQNHNKKINVCQLRNSAVEIKVNVIGKFDDYWAVHRNLFL